MFALRAVFDRIVRGVCPNTSCAVGTLHGEAASCFPQGNTSLLTGGYGIRPYRYVLCFIIYAAIKCHSRMSRSKRIGIKIAGSILPTLIFAMLSILMPMAKIRIEPTKDICEMTASVKNGSM